MGVDLGMRVRERSAGDERGGGGGLKVGGAVWGI